MDNYNEKERVKKVAEKNSLVEKQIQDKPYITILIVLGIACIIFATMLTIEQTLTIGRTEGTLYVIGGVLVFGAYLWKENDEKKIHDINKAIDSDDGDSYQEERIS